MCKTSTCLKSVSWLAICDCAERKNICCLPHLIQITIINNCTSDGLSVMQLYISGYEKSMSATAQPENTEFESQDLVKLLLENWKNTHANSTAN